MTRIRVLSDRVANQIAAGEVIERPAAAVKELVENSLDAGATRVEVEFADGGRSLIRVEDNGCGMSKDDALLSLERHATSKISEAADLNALATFGFRGEALPSIASVSRFELQTRERGQDVGTEILINGGRFVHVRECGRAVGTRIVVTQLFNSVPARRKFLKSDQTEAAHIIQAVRLYALAFPEVAFVLTEDGRVIFRSPQCSTLAERVAGIFGKQISAGLLPISAAETGMRLEGLVGPPGEGRPTRHEMIAFVNRRPVDSRTLNYALIESYHESLPRGKYPAAFVFFEIDPAAVDVNVHPTKREVRFRNESGIRGFVIRSVLERLRRYGEEFAPKVMTLPPIASSAGPAAALPPLRLPSVWGPSPGGAETLANDRIGREALAGTEPLRTATPNAVDAGVANVASTAGQPTTKTWRYLGLAHGDYAIFETPAGVLLLERRAAHERIWFERLQAQFRAGSVPSQRLLLPIPVELDPIATALLCENLSFLAQHGFEVSEFGRNFFRIESLPTWMEPSVAEVFLRDLLGAVREGRLRPENLEVARDEMARMAVARAIRLPEAASEAEMLALAAQLLACRNPLTTPGGRTTYLELSQNELQRRFQR